MKVDILMPTYNGGLFLREQLDSIIVQTHKDWTLKIRDDGSSDTTTVIINDYKNKYPDKIKVLTDNKGRVGVINNCSLLLSKSTADYIMFCDQDDVWLPFKIEKTLEKMLEIEKQRPGIPILVHTDMKVTDSELNVVSDSFFEYQHINPEIKSINRLLVQNNVTGCTSMFNLALKKKITLPIPKNILMHDWYLALNASLFGSIEYMPKPTMLYRQHSLNSVGAKKYNVRYMFKKLINYLNENSLYKCQLQAKELNTDNEAVREFSNLNKNSFFNRKLKTFKYGFFKSGLLRNVCLLVVI